ncbi:hypothetical protein [Aminipila terrae]|uniref:Uncharacterized protein n=1 Tax=Aminipila terrae TaxID=2697030 RepID=A0A6P1MFP6_9FIRM|nr:hypothetical protein [Aminipila terrae]QHI73520.1 hypothetical protein Ami3637_15060 [Aminipila terrae]
MQIKWEKIKVIVLIACILLALFGIYQLISRLSFVGDRNFTLGGGYTCDKMPFDTMSFEIDGSNKFTYYYGNEQLVDNGTFTKVSDGVYSLNSSTFFKDEKLKCYKKYPSESGFKVKINGVECKFVQQTSEPVYINKNTE